jgi:glucosyl-3-phosphoglycerate synthase
MATDFHQHGMFTTLQDLDGPQAAVHRATVLAEAAKRQGNPAKMALVLPALYRDAGSASMLGIVEGLKEVDYLASVVPAITFSATDEITSDRVGEVRRLFDGFKSPIQPIWINSGPVQQYFKRLKDQSLDPGLNGKGRTVWLAYGYLLAKGVGYVATHDCDIVGYNADIPARLFFPLVGNSRFSFAKGFYARAKGKLYGRVSRLFLFPFLGAMEKLQGLQPVGSNDFVRFMKGFRYPLAGEFAISASLVSKISFPSDYGLEVGTLDQVHGLTAPRRVCQVDLDLNYDHFHQKAAGTPEKKGGLELMVAQIVESLLRTMAARGVTFDPHSLRAAYFDQAKQMVTTYRAVADYNGLPYDQHEETTTVEIFERAIADGVANYLARPTGGSLLPSWERVFSSSDRAQQELIEAVEAGPIDMVQNP